MWTLSVARKLTKIVAVATDPILSLERNMTRLRSFSTSQVNGAAHNFLGGFRRAFEQFSQYSTRYEVPNVSHLWIPVPLKNKNQGLVQKRNLASRGVKTDDEDWPTKFHFLRELSLFDDYHCIDQLGRNKPSRRRTISFRSSWTSVERCYTVMQCKLFAETTIFFSLAIWDTGVQRLPERHCSTSVERLGWRPRIGF